MALQIICLKSNVPISHLANIFLNRKEKKKTNASLPQFLLEEDSAYLVFRNERLWIDQELLTMVL
jgi:hypothetical protein